MNERIIFLGTPEISAELLEGLVKNNFNVVGVVTKEDKVRGRNNQVEESPVAIMAHKYDIPVHKPHRLNKDYQFVTDLKPDLLLTFAFGQILSEEVLKLGKYKPLNLHASLLPKYRGAAPIQYALRNGDKVTGVSLMEMVKEMDAGDVYGVKEVEILPEDNYTSLSKKLTQAALELAVEKLPLFFENKIVPAKQDENLVSFCPSIKKEEEHLDLNLGKEAFINQVRSLSYTPGGYLFWNEELLKIYEAKIENDDVTSSVGTIVLAKKKKILLQLKDGQVNLTLLQRPGKKRMTASDFNNGVHNLEGSLLK